MCSERVLFYRKQRIFMLDVRSCTDREYTKRVSEIFDGREQQNDAIQREVCIRYKLICTTNLESKLLWNMYHRVVLLSVLQLQKLENCLLCIFRFLGKYSTCSNDLNFADYTIVINTLCCSYRRFLRDVALWRDICNKNTWNLRIYC